MRERLYAYDLKELADGITPAYAGKTGSSAAGLPLKRDHPRVCGKDSIKMTRRASNQGSPPRMRERHFVKRDVVFENGITPAYAGKTLIALRDFEAGGDHPRVCGKDCHNVTVKPIEGGSPPRMRERLLPVWSWGGEIRVTPANGGERVSGWVVG